MPEIKIASLFPFKVLNVAASAYAIYSIAFLVAFSVRFYGSGISSNPADWISMSEMLGALIGPPLALWSIAFVLKSIQLQQEQVAIQQGQHEQILERENMRLNPEVQRVELAASPAWEQGSLGGKTFNLTVKGDANWIQSTNADGANPAAIKNRDGTIEVVLWKAPSSDQAYRGFVQYERLNGAQGWYWISVSIGDGDDDGFGFALSSVPGPEVGGGVEMEVRCLP